jgi:hypothetical protein
LRALVAQVRFLDTMMADGDEMAQLADEWHAHEALFGPDAADVTWAELRDALLPVRLTDSGADEAMAVCGLARVATDHRVEALPPHCDTVWSAFCYLVGANAAPNSLPPWMILLDCIAERLGTDPARARAIHRWIRAWARQWRVEDRLNEAPWRSSRTEQERAAPTYLVIQIDPDPRDGNRIVLSHWRQLDPLAWRPLRRPDLHVERAGLEDAVDRVVTEMEAMLGRLPDAGRAGQLVLEFVLPLQLLNEPVEFWRRRSPVGGQSMPFAMDHPIVLRSLERLRAPSYHLAWRRRWNEFKRRPGSMRAYWSQPSGRDYFVRLAAELSADQSIVSLVLSEPLKPGNARAREEWAVALRHGVPAIVWHREDCANGEFRDAVAALVADGGLAQLPQRVAELRRDALRSGAGELAAHAGRNLAILWDDPERLPEFPGAVGGLGEGTA